MKRLHLRLRDERGFSLIELVFVMAILGTVMAGVTTVFISGSRAELSVNNRFQAQESARLAMAALRNDVHGACAGAVTTTPKQSLTLSIPSGVGPTPTTQCGTVKKIYILCPSPTNSNRSALYTATDLTCSTASKVKLVADNLTNTTSKPAFASTLAASSPSACGGSGCINWGETATVDADFLVNLQSGTAGSVGLQTARAFELQERLALQNTVWTTVSGTACSAGTPCTQGPCDAVDPLSLLNIPCYPPSIS